jgi:uncharacterized protein (DUF1330 family)
MEAPSDTPLKGYWIVHLEIGDPEGLKAYGPLARSSIAAYGGRGLVSRASASTWVEGGSPKVVVVEFPTYQIALDCYHSPEYQSAIGARADHATCQFVIVEGLGG